MTIPVNFVTNQYVQFPVNGHFDAPIRRRCAPRQVRRRTASPSADEARRLTAATDRGAGAAPLGAERGTERTAQGATGLGFASTAPTGSARKIECASAACSPAYALSIGDRSRGRCRQRSATGAARAGAGGSTVEPRTTRFPDAVVSTGMNKASKNQNLTRHLLSPHAEHRPARSGAMLRTTRTIRDGLKCADWRPGARPQRPAGFVMR